MLKEFSSILISKNATVKEAMKQLDKTAEKILFVVEAENKLIGSLTDGDLRRWILKEGSLSEKIEKVCFKETYHAKANFNLDDIKKQMQKLRINYVPVIDEKKSITEFLVWDKLFESNIIRKTKDKLDVVVVIMAGGKGTRLDPFTRILPKPLVPIGDKSILEIIIEKFSDYKINEFYISVNHKAKIIKSYFEELKPSYKINYLLEDKPLGTVGAVKVLEGKVHKEILLTNCDIIIDANYNDLLRHHNEQKNDITIVASLKHYKIPYGVCEIENGGKIIQITEKPEYDLLINTGMYVINPKVLKFIPDSTSFHITHLIDKIRSTHKIGIYPISEKSWKDIGEWSEYKKTLSKFDF